MYGYACINTKLRAQDVFTSRTIRKSTFTQLGLTKVSELALQNCNDLLTILRWNEQHNIRFFRISSNLFPWCSEYDLFDLPNIDAIANVLETIGDFATTHNHRLTFHPDHFCKLASPKSDVVGKSIAELEVHGLIFDLMGFEPSTYNKINIHVGGVYDDKLATTKRFNQNFCRLSESVQRRLTVENDDKSSMYSVMDLYQLVHKVIDIPIVFDYHHHQFCTGSLDVSAALEVATTTWQDVKPVVHYSESRRSEQNDDSIKPQAHSDLVVGPVDTHGFDVDVMIEAKLKEQALFGLRGF